MTWTIVTALAGMVALLWEKYRHQGTKRKAEELKNQLNEERRVSETHARNVLSLARVADEARKEIEHLEELALEGATPDAVRAELRRVFQARGSSGHSPRVPDGTTPSPQGPGVRQSG